MNLLGIYTVGVARSLCRRLLLDIVIVIVHIVMALSASFMQCAPETTKFGEITQIRAISPFKAIQGHQFLVPIESSYTTFY